MIEKLDINSKYIDDLEVFDTFNKEKVLFDIENNTFTNYYIYKDNNKVVAFINYQIMYERSELININVLDEYQNRGIASKLMEFMLDDLKTNGVKDITLEVKVTNDKAIHLYKKYGFEEVSIRKGYYQGIDGILMKKELM